MLTKTENQKQKPKIASFPRKREFGNATLRQFIGNGWSSKNRIPACAGMTGNGGDLSEITETPTAVIPTKWESRNEKQQEFIGKG